ncbi:hypothetical protein RJ640_027688 [Escallonia rubra]|uniref:Uncharacterized protein n=1 Tax=Escallonia rubra TaxID=112253 RepID=A0AA88UQ03_9ASTE|nr:hypothetical protein RJ640_027688 [Escallonia rubra]
MSSLQSDKNNIVVCLWKVAAISGIVLYLLSVFLFHNPLFHNPASEFFPPSHLLCPSSEPNASASPTNINHLMFGILASAKTWRQRKPYTDSWWRPNVTRGYLYFDVAPSGDLLPWSPLSPPPRVSDDITELLKESKHRRPMMVRMVHAILELFREEHEGVRWYIMGDDDSIFFPENMVDVLGKLDHTKYIYVGCNSENIKSNLGFSFNMGFGGGGFALSYPLAEALSKDLDNCFKRYPYLRSADEMTMACIDDIGVSLTVNKGIHQIDLHNDLSGLLSSHPQVPLLSLHHFDQVNPIFPKLNRAESAFHLRKAADVDQSRLLRQTICYHKQSNWSFSVSWGYSAHIYESVIPRTTLKKPLETFKPWVRNTRPPLFIFNTRKVTNDPCEAPHVFFFDSIEKRSVNEIVTSYVRAARRGLSACSSSGNHSADYVTRITVFSSATKLNESHKFLVELSYDQCVAGNLCKTVVLSGLVLYLLSVFLLNRPSCPASEFLTLTWPSPRPIPFTESHYAPTNLSHLVFCIVGTAKEWKTRKSYIEPWWRPNETRGYLYLDVAPTEDLLPWSPFSPPFKVSNVDTSQLLYTRHPFEGFVVRIIHAILEVFREEHEGVRWYVMGDDDSIFFVDNMVDVLGKYDHTKYYYIGANSEDIKSNVEFSFDMGFGGAGYALSYTLAEALVKNLEDCIRLHPHLRAADLVLTSCIADLGVSLVLHKGLHQIDVHNDTSGLLSSHPQVPLLSLHHFDLVHPIFPTLSRSESARHLMEAANYDQSRMLQQTVCHHKKFNWSFSISWGYSAHIYEKIIHRSVLKKPMETFKPWRKISYYPFYMFDTRRLKEPCDVPHLFYFESVEKTAENQILTSYVRAEPHELPACRSSTNHSADHVSEILVRSPTTKFVQTGRSECCDVIRAGDRDDVVEIKFRDCRKYEMIA